MDTFSPSQRSEVMRRVRSKDTGPELLVRRLVHALGFRYRLHDRKLPGHPDLSFPVRRKVIFVHGCFWHKHRCAGGALPKSNRRYWASKLKGNTERDRRNKIALRRAGWRALVIWECERSDLRKMQKRVSDFLSEK